MQLQLYFTKEEMINFLEREGYQIKTVKSVKSYNTYHNQVEDSCFNTEVAFNEDNKFTDPNEKHQHRTLENYLLEAVFSRTIKSKLLNL